MIYTLKNQIDNTTISIDIDSSVTEYELRKYIKEFHDKCELYNFDHCTEKPSYTAYLIAYDLLKELLVNGRYEAKKIIDNYILESTLNISVPYYYRRQFRMSALELQGSKQ